MTPNETPQKQNFRRDKRRHLFPGDGVLQIEGVKGSARGRLGDISLSGLGATFESDPKLKVRGEPVEATLELDGRVIRGELIVLNRRPGDGSDVRIGAMFHPRSAEDEQAWLAVVPQPKRVKNEAESSPAEPTVLLIRCGSCHRAIGLTESCEEGGLSLAECGHCSQQHILPVLGLLRIPRSKRQVQTIARDHGIDLPAALSVLLGILTIEQVLDTIDSKPTEEPCDAEPVSEFDALDLDPAFQDAVEAGTLTVAQANQRGSRALFAEKLVTRHGLSESVALDVADNRVPLIEAIRRRGPREPIRGRFPKEAQPTVRTLVLAGALALLLLAVGAFETWRPIATAEAGGREATVAKREQTIASASILRDHLGRVVEISASDPRHVLMAYCSPAGDGALRRPLEVAYPMPPEAGLRLGIFENAGEDGSRMAIRIMRKDGARRWVAGGDGAPVAEIAAPDLPPRSPRIPID